MDKSERSMMDGSRTSTKFMCLGQIESLIAPDQLENGIFLEGLIDLIKWNHPLPKLYMKLEYDNNTKVSTYAIIGKQTKNILSSLIAYRMLMSSRSQQRKITTYELLVVIFDPVPGQQELIELYQNMGFI